MFSASPVPPALLLLTPCPESSLHPDITANDNIKVIALPPAPGKPASVPFLLFAPIKVLSQLVHLLHALAYRTAPAEWLLVQTPPALPTLAAAALASQLRGTRLMIDWHNYGWTILAGTRGARHPLVGLARRLETALGRAGFFHLTVTDAMGRQLRRPPYRLAAPLMPVHDRPAAIFQPLADDDAGARRSVLERVVPAQHRGLVPRILDGSVRLVVSSTSWTPDEDFGLLLDALVEYAAAGASRSAPAPLLAIITGKGPQRDMYVERVAALTAAGRLPGVTVATAFLPLGDYAALLAAADLGVCLHRSSSGVDLPMKVVDMFGAGLPVAAYAGYESFGELVREGANGRGFETARELAGILARLLGTKEGARELAMLRRGAVHEGSRRWDEEWEGTVGLVLGLVGR